MVVKTAQDYLSFKILEWCARTKVLIFIPLIAYFIGCWLEERRYGH